MNNIYILVLLWIPKLEYKKKANVWLTQSLIVKNSKLFHNTIEPNTFFCMNTFLQVSLQKKSLKLKTTNGTYKQIIVCDE